MRRDAIKLGVFAVVSALVLLVIHNTMTKSPEGPTRAYRADFTSVAGLRVGDDVRAAGVEVGRVEKIELVHGDTARVTIRVGQAQPLTSTTGLVVRYQNLLGQRYPRDDAGTRAGHDPGRRLARADLPHEPGLRPHGAAERLQAVVRGARPEADQPARDVDRQGAAGRGRHRPGAARPDRDAHDEPRRQGRGHRPGRHAPDAPCWRTSPTASRSSTDTVRELRALTKGLADQRRTIGASIDGLADLSDATADLLARTRPDVRRTIVALRGTARLFARNADLLNAMFRTVPIATGAFARPMSYGTWLNMYICNMGVEVGGTLVNVGPKDGPYSEVCRS
ncbi:MAG: MlaD family protein [Aeromicrobium erythreum]